MAPVRVLLPFIGGSIVGGSHVSAAGLLAALDPARVDARIVLHGPPGPVTAFFADARLPFESVDVPVVGSGGAERARLGPVPGYLRRTLPGLRRLLRRLDPAVVHTNDGRMHCNYALPTRLAGRRLLWHHRGEPDAAGVNLLAPLCADRIVAVSEYARPNRAILPVARIFRVVRSPFDFPVRPDVAAARCALRAEIGAAPDAVVLGYFGSLTERKRPQDFVRVVAATKAMLPDADVRGVLFGRLARPGSGIDDEIRAVAAELGVADTVRLMGFRGDVEHAIAGVDVTVVTALGEPFGRTLIEAMYLGTPVVATRHGGNVEAIRHMATGVLVEPGDPARFAPPIAALVRDRPLRSRIVAAAQAEAARNYGVAGHVAEITAIYEDLARPSRDRSRGRLGVPDAPRSA